MLQSCNYIVTSAAASPPRSSVRMYKPACGIHHAAYESPKLIGSMILATHLRPASSLASALPRSRGRTGPSLSQHASNQGVAFLGWQHSPALAMSNRSKTSPARQCCGCTKKFPDCMVLESRYLLEGSGLPFMHLPFPQGNLVGLVMLLSSPIGLSPLSVFLLLE